MVDQWLESYGSKNLKRRENWFRVQLQVVHHLKVHFKGYQICHCPKCKQKPQNIEHQYEQTSGTFFK